MKETAQKNVAELGQRVRELNCLFKISRLVEKRGLSIEEFFQGIVNLIPPAWQYPEITCAKIVFDKQEFKTNNFKETIWKLSADVKVGEKLSGKLMVYYLEEKPERDEGPFIKEERDLINSVAERLGRIAERKQAIAALKNSEKRFRDLVENSLTGISIIQDRQIVYQNQEQQRILGPLPRSAKFEDIESIHPDDVKKVKQFYKTLSSKKILKGDIDFRFFPPGKKESLHDLKWVHCRASLIEYQGKDAIMVNTIDVTRIRELEYLLRMKDKMSSLGRVAAGIAHEIRSPLSGINIYLNTLKKFYDSGGSSDKIYQIINQLYSASNKIESVIKRVMDFSKPGEPKFTSINIRHSIEEAIQLTRITLQKSGISLEKDLSENLPACYADPNLIEEVVLNLINNAAEAMKKMQEGKIIIVSASPKNDCIVITVSDSGPGVPLNIRNQIFDPFFTTKHEGSGIGLSLSHRIIADHGGSLTLFDSELGGAEFRIEIPIKT